MTRFKKLAVGSMQLVINLLLAVLFAIAVSMALPFHVSDVVLVLGAAYVLLTLVQYAVGGRIPRGILTATTAYACADVPGGVGSAYTQAGNCLEEGSTFIGFFLVKRGFNLSGLTDGTTYAAAKSAADIVPVRDVEAFMTPGTPVYSKARNGRQGRLTRIDWDIPFTYEGVDANLHFQNALNHSRNYGVAFVTEEYKVYAPLDRDLEPILVNFFATPQGDQEYGQSRYMGGSMKYQNKDLPQLIEYAGLAKAIIIADFQP